MATVLEERLQQQLGVLVYDVISLQVENEQLKAQIEILKMVPPESKEVTGSWKS